MPELSILHRASPTCSRKKEVRGTKGATTASASATRSLLVAASTISSPNVSTSRQLPRSRRVPTSLPVPTESTTSIGRPGQSRWASASACTDGLLATMAPSWKRSPRELNSSKK